MQIYDGADVVRINFESIAHAHGVSQRSVVDDRMLVVNAIYPHIRALYTPESGRGGEALGASLLREPLGADVGDDAIRRRPADDSRKDTRRIHRVIAASLRLRGVHKDIGARADLGDAL